MGVVTGTIEVSADPAATFRVARKVESYPDFMPDVRSIRVLERRDDGYSRTEWVGHVSVASIDRDVRWVEDAWWTEDELRSRFELVEGDYKHYRGEWKFEAVDRGTRIILTVDFDLGLPLVGALIAKLLDRIMQNNIDGMLQAIKNRVESSS
jgi:ribosome-associated toxin RatA of RatAB toxin-antitoxin module